MDESIHGLLLSLFLSTLATSQFPGFLLRLCNVFIRETTTMYSMVSLRAYVRAFVSMQKTAIAATAVKRLMLG